MSLTNAFKLGYIQHLVILLSLMEYIKLQSHLKRKKCHAGSIRNGGKESSVSPQSNLFTRRP